MLLLAAGVAEPEVNEFDVFIGDFTMCHTLPLADRLHIEPVTIPLAELFLSKAQIVDLNRKDVLDLLTLILDHGAAPAHRDAPAAAAGPSRRIGTDPRPRR